MTIYVTPIVYQYVYESTYYLKVPKVRNITVTIPYLEIALENFNNGCVAKLFLKK